MTLPLNNDKRKNTNDQPSFEKSRRPWNMERDDVHTHDYTRFTKSRCLFTTISQLHKSVRFLTVASEQRLYAAIVCLPHMCYQHICLFTTCAFLFGDFCTTTFCKLFLMTNYLSNCYIHWVHDAYIYCGVTFVTALLINSIRKYSIRKRKLRICTILKPERYLLFSTEINKNQNIYS